MATVPRADQVIHARGLLLACCAAGAAKSIEPPLNVFYPPGQEVFNAGLLDARLLTSMTAIVTVVVLLAGGLLGDIYGRRRLLLIGLGASVFANTCLLFAPSVAWHMFWRAVALAAGAVVLPLALAPIYSCYRGAQQGRALGIYILTTTVLGLLVVRQGRILTAAFGWHAAYLAPLLIGLAALGLGWKYVPEQKAAGHQHRQAINMTGWVLVVLASMFAMVQSTVTDKWLSLTLAAAVVTLLIGVIIVFWWDIRTPGMAKSGPTVRTRDVTVLIVIGVLIQLLLIGVYQPTYDLYSVAQGRSALSTLLALTPLLLGMLASLFMIWRLLHARQVGKIIAAGLVVVSAATLLLSINPMSGPWLLHAFALFLFGSAILATKTVWTNGLFQTLTDDYVGANAAMQSATVQIGGALGAVMSAQLLVRFGQNAVEGVLATHGVQLEQVGAIFRHLTLIIGLRVPLDVDPFGELLREAYGAAFAAAYSRTLWLLGGLALVAAIVIGVGVRRSLRFRGRVATSAMLD